MTDKGPAAFRSISEASAEVGVPSHVLRFWETRFSFIRPMKRAGGRRFYRPHDLEVLRGVRSLLHEEGYTIKGVQKLMKGQGRQQIVTNDLGVPANNSEAPVAAALVEVETVPELSARDRQRQVLESMLDELKDLRAMIRSGE